MPEVETNFGDWDVENLRLSIFHREESFDTTPTGLWAKVINSEPETFESKPREGVVREFGRVGENNLLLAAQRGRIDWIAQPILTQDHPGDSVLLLEAAEHAVLPLLQRCLVLTLESIQQVERLAFGASLLKQVDDLAMAIQQVAEHLPDMRFESMEGADFTYQVNRRRRSKTVSHAEINRLAKWSTQHFGTLQLQIRPPGQPRVQESDAGVVRTLHLDMNTTPDTAEIDHSAVPDLFDELLGLAREIANTGDTD